MSHHSLFKNLKKPSLGFISSVAIIVALGIGASWYLTSKTPSIIPSTSANYDYVCTITVTNPVCSYDPAKDCGPWKDKKKTCTGLKYTALKYSTHRINCTGYAEMQQVWDQGNAGYFNWAANNSNLWLGQLDVAHVQQEYVDSNWAGENSQDSGYWTSEACTVVITDVNAPLGAITGSLAPQ